MLNCLIMAEEVDESISNLQSSESLQNLAAMLDEEESIAVEESLDTSGDSLLSPRFLFRRLPELDQAYRRGGWKPNRQADHTCIFCLTVLKTCHVKRLAEHSIKCKNLKEENPELQNVIREKFRNLPLISGSEEDKNNDRLNLQWVRILARRNISFSFMNDPLFRKWIRENCRNFRPASRQLMASKYLPFESHSISTQLSLLVANSTDFFMSIEFDHLTDTMSHRSILGIIGTIANGARMLIALEDVTLYGKSAAAILKPLKEQLSQFNSRKINSIISDSASSCKAAREKLLQETEYKHVIQHRCLAHLLNSIGEDIFKATCMKQLFETATKLTSFINNHLKLAALLKEAGHNRLVKSTPTRWYSHVNMLESLQEVKEEAKILLESSNDNEQQELLSELAFLNDLSNAIRILRPLANCIAVAEKADGSVGEAVKAMLEFAKSLFKLNWDNEFVMAAINSFLTYFSEAKLGDELYLLLACYFLDKRNKMSYITEFGIEKLFYCIATTARRSGYRMSNIQELLPNEFQSYCKQDGQYAKLPKEGELASEWWSNMADCGVLRQVGFRLANLKSSSANCERLFKDIKEAQCPNRTNYHLETLSHLMTVKLSVRQLQDDEFSESTDESHSPSVLSSQSLPKPSLSRRHSRNPSTRIDRHLENPQQIGDELPGSQASTLTIFSCGSQGRFEPQAYRLESESLITAYNNFIKLIDFSIVNGYKLDSIETSLDEPEECDFESIIGKLRQVRSQDSTNDSADLGSTGDLSPPNGTTD